MTRRQSYFCFDRNYSRIVNKVGLLGLVIPPLGVKWWQQLAPRSEGGKQTTKNGDQVYRVKLVRERENITSKGKKQKKREKNERERGKKINNFPTKQKNQGKKKGQPFIVGIFSLLITLYTFLFVFAFSLSGLLIHIYILTYTFTFTQILAFINNNGFRYRRANGRR